MNLLAVPLTWQLGDPSRLTRILDRFVERPDFTMQQSTPDQRRTLAASVLANPHNFCYEVWRGPDFAGILTLQDVVPQHDAVWHVFFLDGKLLGKRAFLWAFLGHCFHHHGLRRVTVKVPEFQTTLRDWFRRKLYFRFEGEPRACIHPEIQRLNELRPGSKPHIWAASIGSRIERAHWHNGEWHDVFRLRLFAEEYAEKEAECRSKPLPPPLVVPS